MTNESAGKVQFTTVRESEALEGAHERSLERQGHSHVEVPTLIAPDFLAGKLAPCPAQTASRNDAKDRNDGGAVKGRERPSAPSTIDVRPSYLLSNQYSPSAETSFRVAFPSAGSSSKPVYLARPLMPRSLPVPPFVM